MIILSIRFRLCGFHSRVSRRKACHLKMHSVYLHIHMEREFSRLASQSRADSGTYSQTRKEYGPSRLEFATVRWAFLKSRTGVKKKAQRSSHSRVRAKRSLCGRSPTVTGFNNLWLERKEKKNDWKKKLNFVNSVVHNGIFNS